MRYTTEIGNFIAEKQENGTFLYKAKQQSVSSSKKIDKPKYKERPQYPLIEQYELKAVERFQQDIKNTVKQVVQLLITISNE
jgi:hypothetical protein